MSLLSSIHSFSLTGVSVALPQDKKKREVDTDEWERCMPGPDVPQQDNCSDCGMFTLMFANFIARGLSPSEEDGARACFPDCLVRQCSMGAL